MSDENALVPVEERTVIFYDDELTAVLVRVGGEEQVFVPIRPLCEYLGVDWSAQYRRLSRDPVLGDAQATVAITATDGRVREQVCLPLEYLNGWLFGVSADRVKPEIRERLIRYQKECYRVLARAFVKEPSASDVSPTTATLLQVREMGRAIMQMAEEQIEFERRLTTTEGRLDQAAVIVGDLNRRVASLEQKVAPGKPVTEDQASQTQSPQLPQPQHHAQGALLYPFSVRTAVSRSVRRINLYRLFKASQHNLPVQSGCYPQEFPQNCNFPRHRGSYDAARWRMSLKVAKIININTSASPIRKPISWARSDSGRPRAASIP